jgi:anti-repressor protein
MSNQIQIFNFNSTQVRLQIINNKEYFCAKDVCTILEIKNNRQALSRVSHEDVIMTDAPTNSGIQQMSFVNEAGLYALIFQSKKPEATEFKKWVFDKILPSIRKTGKFEVKEFTKKELLLMALEQEEKIEALQIENTQKEKIINEFIAIEGTKNYTEVAKILHKKPMEFITWLRDCGYICVNRLPKQEYINRGYFVIKKTTNELGRKCESYRITPRGFDYFQKKI